MATGRRRGRAMLYIALILILLLVLAAALWFRSQTQTPPRTVNPPASQGSSSVTAPTALSDKVEILYLSREVRRGQAITDDMLVKREIDSKDYTPGVYYKDNADLAGARAKFDLRGDTALTKSVVLEAGTTGSVPSFEIPAGKVAISVPISKLSSVAYGLQKGDHVNVISSLLMVDVDTNFQAKLPNRTGIVIAPGPINENQAYVTAVVHSGAGYAAAAGDALSYMGRIEIDPTMNNPVYVLPSEQQRPRLVSQTLIQDVVILQMGTFSKPTVTQDQPITAPIPQPGQPTPKPTTAAQQRQTQSQGSSTSETPATVPDVVTLIVSPQDAVTLNYLMLAGANLNMVLRSAGDSEVKNTEAVTLQFILDQYQIPNPAKLPYGLEPRLDSFPVLVQPFPEPGIAPTPTPVSNK